jgi:hypothetical protein
MRKRILISLIASIACLGNSIPVSAHHGYAAYDMTKTIVAKGTVTDYELANPHSTMSFDAKDETGKVQSYIAEAGHIRLMRDEGWKVDTLKPGDVVTFYFHPAKNGSHSVDLEKIVLPDGRALWAHSSHDKDANDTN